MKLKDESYSLIPSSLNSYHDLNYRQVVAKLKCILLYFLFLLFLPLLIHFDLLPDHNCQ